MRPTTKLCMALQNIGRPSESLEFEGNMAQCARKLAEYMTEHDMPKEWVVSFARDMDTCRVRLGAKRSSNLLDGIFDDAAFMEDMDKAVAAAAEQGKLD